MSEKFISYDNLKQYDEFLDKELQDIKQHVDEGFTFNVKYAESDEIGGAAIKAISDETGENIAEHFDNIENDVTINKTTLGYQKKNLIKNNTKSSTIQGVTITVNDDKSITVSGANTGDTIWHNVYGTQDIPMTELEIGQSYILSGTPTDNIDNNGSRTAYLRIEKRSMVIASDSKGNGAEFTVTSNVRPEYVILYIGRGADYTDKPITFYPMIRHAEVTDSMYEPYVDDVNTRLEALADNVNLNSSDIAALGTDVTITRDTLGYQKKNLFDWENAEKVSGVVTFEKTDTSISVTSHDPWDFVSYKLPKLEIGREYTFSATISDFSKDSAAHISAVKIALYNSPGGGTLVAYANITKNGEYEIKFTSTSSMIYVLFYPNWNETAYTNSFTASNIMLRYSDIIDNTYEPYVESVDERLQNFVKSGSGAKAGLVPAPSTTAGTTKYLREDGTWQIPPDNNTHYTSKNVVGSKTATTNTTTALTNGNVYLNSVENGVVTSAHKISGSGTTTVTTDINGNIIIKSTDANTDTKVTQTVKTDNANYPLLCAPSGQTATATTTTYFDSGVTLNPSTNTIAANISGTSAKATADKNGKDITKTYLPLAGGTMDAGASIKMVYGTDNRYTEYKHNIKMVAPNSGWANGVSFYANDGTSLLGSYGAYGNATALNYYYIGGTYDNPLFKLNAEGDGTFKGSCSATSFKTLDTNLISSGSITMPTELTEKVEITINNLSNYSTLYLELTNRTGVVSSNIIPINYLLESTNKYISVPFHADASDDVYDIITCIMEISASTNKIILQAPTLVGATNVAKCGSLLYKVFKF